MAELYAGLRDFGRSSEGGHSAGAAWFCVRSLHKHEHIAAAHLRRLSGVEVFNPQLRLVRLTRRGLLWTTESLFPNYLFARFPLLSMLEKVRYTPGVKTVLQFGDRVPEIPEPVIEDLRQSLAANTSTVFTDAPLEGEEVEITAGPFQGTTGEVIRVLPAKQRVQILLNVMGRSVPTEFGLDSVLSKRKDAASLVWRQAEAGDRLHWTPEPPAMNWTDHALSSLAPGFAKSPPMALLTARVSAARGPVAQISV